MEEAEPENGAASVYLCEFCKCAPRRYTCPRCNNNYCSLTCYNSKGHLECTEHFYKECVLKQLGDTDYNPDQAKRITEILGTMYNMDPDQEGPYDPIDSDDDECVSLSERMAGVDLDDSKQVWKKLTTDERQDFEAFLRSTDVKNFVPEWRPWWKWRANKIEEVGNVSKYKQNCPEIKGNIKSFYSITTKAPAECVRYNLANIVCTYAFTARYFNGDHFEFVDETVGYITILSLCLRRNANFESLGEALESVLNECFNNNIAIDTENTKYLNEDSKMILRGPCESDSKYYVLCALSEIHKLINLILSKGTAPKVSYFDTADLSLKQLKLCSKKIEYFLSYTSSYFDPDHYA